MNTRVVRWLSAWALLGAAAAPLRAEPAPVEGVTVVQPAGSAHVERALVEGSALWIPLDALESVTGLELKPQGLCRGALCVPLTPAERQALLVDRDQVQWISLTDAAAKLNQVVEAVPDEKVWSFGEVPAAVATELGAGLAPDFELPDREGKKFRLSSLRGKKVLLLTWASW